MEWWTTFNDRKVEEEMNFCVLNSKLYHYGKERGDDVHGHSLQSDFPPRGRAATAGKQYAGSQCETGHTCEPANTAKHNIPQKHKQRLPIKLQHLKTDQTENINKNWIP